MKSTSNLEFSALDLCFCFVQDAAAKVREVIEENGMLSKRLDKAVRRSSQLEAETLERQRR